MTREETNRMQELCKLIAQEQDHYKLMQLAEELSQLLEKKIDRLKKSSTAA
ncbi:MAG TPA: hypothetical protein VFA74_08095 [Terriglobales bacterium]|nr:hypothetical protein [Terriglobales bacterium]